MKLDLVMKGDFEVTEVFILIGIFRSGRKCF